jgi:hypothetical protein
MNPITLNKAAATWLPEAAAVILAVIALQKGNPYGYYLFLRWMACPIFVWITWKANSRAYGLLLAIAAGILAVLFNPFIRVMLDRGKMGSHQHRHDLRRFLVGGGFHQIQ